MEENMKKIVLILSFVFLCFTAQAEETENFMVYGTGFMVNVPLPEYWAVDMDLALQNNLNGFFFIEDAGIRNSPVVIILTLAEKPTETSTLNDYLAYDKGLLKDHFPKMIYKPLKNSRKGDRKYTYKIFEFYSEPNGRHQYIAYIDCGVKYITKMYIDIAKKENADKYVSDFLDSVYGFKFISTNVMIE